MSIEHIIVDRNIVVDNCVKFLNNLPHQLMMFFIDSACADHDGIFDLSKHSFNDAKARANKAMKCYLAINMINVVDTDVRGKYKFYVRTAKADIGNVTLGEAHEFALNCIAERSQLDATVYAYSEWLLDDEDVMVTLMWLMSNVKAMTTFYAYKEFDFLQVEAKLVKLAQSLLYGLSYIFLNDHRRQAAIQTYRMLVRQIDISGLNDQQLLELAEADEGYITQLADDILAEGRAVTTLRYMNEYKSGLCHVKPAHIVYDGLRVESTYNGRMPILVRTFVPTTVDVRVMGSSIINDQLKMRIACLQSIKHQQEIVNGSFLHIARAVINDKFMILLNAFVRNDSAAHKSEDIAWEHLVYITVTR